MLSLELAILRCRGMSDSVEKQLAEASKGYLSKEEYKRKREEIEAQEARDKVQVQRLPQHSSPACL